MLNPKSRIGPRQQLILIVIIVLAFAALLGREYAAVNRWGMLAAVLVYLAGSGRKAVAGAKRFRNIAGPDKLSVIIWFLMVLSAGIITAGGGVSYFLLLVLLAGDYLIAENKWKKNDVE